MMRTETRSLKKKIREVNLSKKKLIFLKANEEDDDDAQRWTWVKTKDMN